MEYHEIEKLLNRYLEGETSLEEETLLKDYFSQSQIPTDQLEMKELFCYLVNARKDSTPSFDVSAELNSLIENESKKESAYRFRRILAWTGSAAAVLIISIGTFQYLNKPEPAIKDTFKDPKLAYLETKQALMMVSRVMNRNTAKLKYLVKVNESLDQVQKIAQIDKVVNSIKNK